MQRIDIDVDEIPLKDAAKQIGVKVSIPEMLYVLAARLESAENKREELEERISELET